MLARIRKATEEKDQGFTLIELLVVMIIIGILAAIAIPVFLNQRKKAVDSAMKADLRTIANQEETLFTDNQSYTEVTPASATPLNLTLSTGNQAVVTLPRAGVFCVEVSRAANQSEGSRTSWFYVSDKGGVQTATNASCA